MSAGTLFKNATFHSLEREGETFAALLAGPDGRIAALFPRGAPLPAGQRAVDLGGAVAVPAFIDAHAHFTAKAAVMAAAADLGRFDGRRIMPDCLDGAREILAERAREFPRGIVLGFGLCLAAVAERRMPRASELDDWLPGRSVILVSMDGHSSSYSTPALRELGIAALAEDGILSGEAHDMNMGRITGRVMASLGPAAIARGFAGAVGEALAGGLVAVHCMEGTEDRPSDPAVSLLSALGPSLPLRLRLWLQYTDPARVARFARRLGGKRAGGCMAWEMDGGVSSRSAAFDRPYRDREHAGMLYRDPEAAWALVAPFFRAGWQTSAHAIGPRGIESILRAYERAMGESGERENRLRLRIDHFEFPRPDQVERAGRLGLGLAVQPGFAWVDERFLGGYAEALGEEERALHCPLRSLLDSGCVLALSTDAPVQPFAPFVQVAGAVWHPNPAQRISVYEALRAYSWGGAWTTFEEGERGSLAVGKYADFAVLDRDPFAASDDLALAAVKASMTVHEGVAAAGPPPGLALFAASVLAARRRKM